MEPAPIPSFRVQITNYSKEEGYVTYSIKVYSVEDNSFHIVDRYRNMRSLWEEIRRDALNPDRIPDFPPKRWFGGRSREFLETRKSALQNFFNTLLDGPDKIIYDHIMKYFKKLAKNREAKDAIQNIEESMTVRKKKPKPEPKPAPEPKEETKRGPEITPNKMNSKQGEGVGSDMASMKKDKYKDSRKMITSKDYNEAWGKIVENFNKNLIDLGYTGAEAIQDIMVKGQNYVKHFKDSGLNNEFWYDTNLLGIPKGDDDNIALLETLDEDDEALNDEINDKLQDRLNQFTDKYYKNQFEQFISMNDVIWRGN